MNVAIVDYGSGNLRSAAKAFERAIAEAGLDMGVVVTADANLVRGASHVVLPGVGAFADCKRGLMALPGMADALNQAVICRREARPKSSRFFEWHIVGNWDDVCTSRDHGISEGEGTSLHLRMHITRYLLTHLPPGPR